MTKRTGWRLANCVLSLKWLTWERCTYLFHIHENVGIKSCLHAETHLPSWPEEFFAFEEGMQKHCNSLSFSGRFLVIKTKILSEIKVWSMLFKKEFVHIIFCQKSKKTRTRIGSWGNSKVCDTNYCDGKKCCQGTCSFTWPLTTNTSHYSYTVSIIGSNITVWNGSIGRF